MGIILSASRRTDIPAFYAPWFANRVRAGYAVTRNPFNPAQIKRVSLLRGDVDCTVFWTKNPAPLLAHLDTFPWPYYVQFTLNPYDRTLERSLPDKAVLVETFRELSRRIGRERVLWRYDPIILNDRCTIAYHQNAFTELCDRLAGYTDRVTVSFVDVYPKLRTPLIREITGREIHELSAFIGQTARGCGITPYACCEALDLTPYGIRKGRCIDPDVVAHVTGKPCTAKPDRSQRAHCGCVQAVDIGVYNTCLHGCVYCYANHGDISIRKNAARHDPNSESLL